MSLVALAFMVVVALAPQYPGQVAEVELPRYHTIATEIATAVEQYGEDLPFEGPARLEASAIALAVVARHESDYAADIHRCERKGDHGKSITIYQLYRGVSWKGHTEAQICADPVLAAQLSLRSLGMFVFHGTTLGMFRGYASGSPTTEWGPASRADRMFKQQIKEFGLKVSKQRGCKKLFAEFLSNPVVVSGYATSRNRADTVSSGPP